MYLNASYLIGISKPLDMVLAFQASSRNIFDLQKKIAEKMVRRFEIGPDSINVGMIVSRDFPTSKEFSLKEHSSSKSKLLKAIKEASFPSRSIFNLRGLLEYSKKIMFTDTDSRKFVPKSIVLFFDSTNVPEHLSPLQKISALLKRDGINVLAIGVGENAPIPTVVAGLGDKNQVVPITDEEEIDDGDLVNDIIKKALKGIFFIICCLVTKLH